MNILIYTQKSSYEGYSVGGAETSLRLLAEKLAGRGHRVIYLTQTDWGRLPRYRIRKVDGVEVHLAGFVDLPSLGRPPLLRLRRRMADRRFDRIVYRLVRRHKIDLIHTYHEVPEMLRILRLRERKGFDAVTLLRLGGLFWQSQVERDPSLKSDYEEVYNGVECVNVNTPGLLDLFEESVRSGGLEVTFRERFVHDIGIDLARLPAPWSYPERRARIVMASRLSSRQKRQELLVRALALLPEERRPELLLVGDGPQRDPLLRLAADRGVQNSVTVIPYMEQERLWELISGCRLYVHACDFEGLSKILAEAMGMGVPVLASDVRPLNDYIREGKTGFLVPNTPEAWAARISELTGDRERLRAVSGGSRAWASRELDPDRNVERYIERFEALLGRRRGGV